MASPRTHVTSLLVGVAIGALVGVGVVLALV